MTLTLNRDSKLGLAQKIRLMAAMGGGCDISVRLPQAEALRLAHQLEQAQRLTILRVPEEPGWMFRAAVMLALCCEVMQLSALLAAPVLGLIQ